MNSVQPEADAFPSIVLFLDGDAARLASYCTAFEAEGMWAATCTDPREALDEVRDLRPDLLIVNTYADIRSELVRTLKGDPQTHALPVILLTDHNPRIVGAASQADVCLRNPVSCEQLLASARSLIARSRELRRQGERTRSRTHTLLMTSADLAKRSRADAIRACPQCRQSLEWIERRRLLGLEYDYYRWCVNGCGLYCYECQSRSWIRLA